MCSQIHTYIQSFYIMCDIVRELDTQLKESDKRLKVPGNCRKLLDTWRKEPDHRRREQEHRHKEQTTVANHHPPTRWSWAWFWIRTWKREPLRNHTTRKTTRRSLALFWIRTRKRAFTKPYYSLKTMIKEIPMYFIILSHLAPLSSKRPRRRRKNVFKKGERIHCFFGHPAKEKNSRGTVGRF